MAASQILKLMKDTTKCDDEVMSIIDFLGTPCQPTLECPKFKAIQEHIGDYCDEHLLHTTDNEVVKEAYDKEFWNHAPDNLKETKKLVLEDPFNHFILDKFSKLVKIYKFQIKSPYYTFSDDPEKRKEERKEIVKLMSCHMWDNYDSE